MCTKIEREREREWGGREGKKERERDGKKRCNNSKLLRDRIIPANPNSNPSPSAKGKL